MMTIAVAADHGEAPVSITFDGTAVGLATAFDNAGFDHDRYSEHVINLSDEDQRALTAYLHYFVFREDRDYYHLSFEEAVVDFDSGVYFGSYANVENALDGVSGASSSPVSFEGMTADEAIEECETEYGMYVVRGYGDDDKVYLFYDI